MLKTIAAHKLLNNQSGVDLIDLDVDWESFEDELTLENLNQTFVNKI